MLNYDNIFTKIAQALLADYSSVYYVNADTCEYIWYSNDPTFHSLKLETSGDDFFSDLVRDADKVIYEEDKHIFTEDMSREKLLTQMKNGSMQKIEYRLMIDGEPVYHCLSLIRGLNDTTNYFILGVKNIDIFVKERIAAEKAERESLTYNQIAGSLAEHYDTLYYINMETNEYFEYSSTDVYKSLAIPVTGFDFFAESRKNIRKYAHPDDVEKVLHVFDKLTMLKNLKDTNTFTLCYRLMVGGNVMNIRASQIWASDKKHAIVCIENINAEVNTENELIESRRKSETYGRIAESLASQYDVIYFVDSSTGQYREFTSKNIYGNSPINEEGKDFFNDVIRNAQTLVHPKDRERLLSVVTKDYIVSALESKKLLSMDYRLIINGKPQYTRLTVMWSNDRIHFIIGVENIDDEVKRENEQVKALNQANELARRDGLTGTKNKIAYKELEALTNQKIDNGTIAPFALVVCDINNLKMINDTAGHKAGDDYIRSASRLICNVFTHSPVFRIGGDEFAAFLGSGDYSSKELLLERLRDQVLVNIKNNDGPVLASGMAVYVPEKDRSFADVFQRADSTMYDNKTQLKAGIFENMNTFGTMTAADMNVLDTLFDALELTAEGSYVFLCNMRCNYSRWSKAAVDCFGLPSEYMYDAGSVWEERIHPDDRDIYATSIGDIFSGNASSHDMQYRARKLNGTYDVCTCRGMVLRDLNGKPEWFAGIIRNHGIQGHIDTLTGLRNQYGFFEDLQSNMLKHKEIRAVMIVISKFSEINEVYGYQFGNMVLQKFGRYLFEQVGSDGSAYRLDGTKFAVLTRTLNSEDIRQKYEDMRNYFRKGFSIDGKFVMLDLSAGMLSVDNYDIDFQTVYACLNFAYSESKIRQQGDLVEFYNDLNDHNRQRIEKLYAIRASITQNFKGFYLLYQPVVDASSEKLIGAEALLRWKSDEYGMVPPDHFIPILEKDPLFCELGQWILRTAINGAKLIMEEHPEFVINVNLSYTQLEKPDFVDMVLRTLREEAFPPEHLCMEITERCRLLDMYLLKNVIINLRGHGIQIALDDFGTGFSSIGLVKNLPFDTIKIDRSFVLKIEEDQKERELVKSFAGVATTFGAKVCVEGIETEGMKAILQQYNIQSFQGYFYGKPLEIRDFLLWDHEQLEKKKKAAKQNKK